MKNLRQTLKGSSSWSLATGHTLPRRGFWLLCMLLYVDDMLTFLLGYFNSFWLKTLPLVEKELLQILLNVFGGYGISDPRNTIPNKFLQPYVPSMQLPLQLCELKGKLIPDFFVSKGNYLVLWFIALEVFLNVAFNSLSYSWFECYISSTYLANREENENWFWSCHETLIWVLLPWVPYKQVSRDRNTVTGQPWVDNQEKTATT
jgi:hypothetical protein